ncbi:hypothetical protein J1N10_20805 [Carboxylicivirga sp. A043]|uniref:hypothetical protein n=1 Tax=Carboxylicivirga litoralis TaxID=2816963 RepID=UPI0021CB32A9|nr:hypothetical protein [Carboxylicivirga sp. A043]MCU4158425.1 hypothetical protein [Carboxylicivirga sp. A043]
MKLKALVILLLLTITVQARAWRIEGEMLYLEKGDNIWQVAYSLTGDGGNWKELWATRVDTSVINPFHAYPNMKFKLKSGLFTWNINKKLNSVNLDSSSIFLNNQLQKSTLVSSKSKETNNKILGLDYSFARIIIPVLVTLLVFLLGQLINWFKGKLERITEMKSIKATIEHWILFVEPTINSQIDGCNKFVKALNESTNLQTERFEFSSMLVDKLQQIELRELIETIMLNLKGEEKTKAKMIFNIISQVEFLVKIEAHIQNNYEKFHSYTEELMTNWNSAFTQFNSIMNETSRIVNEAEPNCDFVTAKNKICNDFLSTKEQKPLNKIFDELVLPLESEVDKYLKTPNKQLVVNLGYSIESLKIIKLKWETHKTGHIQLNEGYAKKISDVYNVLKTVASELKKSNFKPLYLIK